MTDFSEKRTYTLNGELIHILKSRKDPKTEKYVITFVNLASKEESTVKAELLDGAVKTVDSTEFFKMWMHFNNFKDKDAGYATEFASNIIHHLYENKLEMHGSGKFERYDFNHFMEMYTYAFGHNMWSNPDLEDIIHSYDGKYTYHNIFTDEQREEYDRMEAMAEIFNNEVQKEIDRELLEKIKSFAISSELIKGD